jgi:hypothetical protein
MSERPVRVYTPAAHNSQPPAIRARVRGWLHRRGCPLENVLEIVLVDVAAARFEVHCLVRSPDGDILLNEDRTAVQTRTVEVDEKGVIPSWWPLYRT